MASISAARQAAFRILLAVERGRRHSGELLRGNEVSALAVADRNLATALVLGVLRWQIFLDQLIRPRLKRPNAKLDAEVLIALRLGVFQLRFLDRIPAHAAIDECVELTKQAGHRFAAGMVNAVLRTVAKGPTAEYENLDEGDAAIQAHPAWLVERWRELYGQEAMQAICRHGQSQPRLHVRLDGAAVEETLRKSGVELAPGQLLSAARAVASGDVTASPAFREGRLRVQDEGSQLIGELAADASETPPANILDACAAPGGKTLILTERHPQALVVACEASPRRFAELQLRLAPLAGRVQCRQTDAAELKEEAAFDLALVDAPCSGTGTLGRNPEIRHRLQPDDLPRHAERQRAILAAALRAVRPGRRVLYSTCSLEPEENEQVVAAALAECGHARQISLAAPIESLARKGILRRDGAERLQPSLTTKGALRLLPAAAPADGFFIALLERSF